MDIQTWFDEKFKPWQEEMVQRAQERQQYGVLVKANARTIKHVVALIHSGQGEDAAAAWNALGFPVQFKTMQLTQEGQWLEVTAMNGEKTAVPMSEMVGILTELLAS